MGKKLALSLLLVIYFRYLSAQNDSIFLFTADDRYTNPSGLKFRMGITGGFGKYIQTDLREINESLRDELPFDTEFTDNFPENYYYGINFLLSLSRSIYAGPDYQFHTTGSRLAYSDYSGSYIFDQIISTHSVGIRLEGASAKRRNPQVSLNVLFGINISKWKIDEKLVVGEQAESSSVRFDALRPFIYPALKLRCRIIKSISLSPSFGFNFDLGGKYHRHNNKAFEIDKQAVWKGPRAELSLEITF